MTVSLRKVVPASDLYNFAGGDITINLAGVETIDVTAKNSLLKIQIPVSKSRWKGSGYTTTKDDALSVRLFNSSDIGNNAAVDLKRIEDSITIKGWLEDDSTRSAWEKAWILRAMCTCGGHLSTLVIDNLTFPTLVKDGGLDYYTILPAFLESVSFSGKPDDSGDATNEFSSNKSDNRARIAVTLIFYIGTLR